MPPPSPRAIVLVGMMGAGKSTVGRLVAARLSWPFADSDAEIERESGRTIADLFAVDGEPRFRALECAVIDRLLHGAPRVLAVGGGAFAEAGTRRLILARATAIWIDVAPEILAGRIGDLSNRPLVNRSDPLFSLKSLSAERQASYALAPIRVDGSGPPEQVAEAVVAALR